MLLSVKELKTFLEQKNVSAAGCAEKGDLVDVIINYQARPERTQAHRTNQPHVNESQASVSGTPNRRQPQSQSQGINDFFGTLQINPEIRDFVTNMFQLNETGVTGLRPSSHEVSNSQNGAETSFSSSSYLQRMAHGNDDRPSCVHPTKVFITLIYICMYVFFKDASLINTC